MLLYEKEQFINYYMETFVNRTFAMNMCERLTHMIGGLATPVDVKLQLIQVFQHMHHDAETAATVRNSIVKLTYKVSSENNN